MPAPSDTERVSEVRSEGKEREGGGQVEKRRDRQIGRRKERKREREGEEEPDEPAKLIMESSL